MPRKEYRFNPQTLTYEVVMAPFKMRFYRMLRKVLIGFILASLVNFAFSYFVYTPKMYRISRENAGIVLKYDLLKDKMSALSHKLDEIKHRDNNVYRPLFAADTLAIDGIYDPYPDEKYNSFSKDHFAPLMTSAWKQIDAIARRLYLESKSLDELQELSRDKEQMALAVPAIWPIDKRGLRGNIGAFGGRNHPVFHRFIMHEGVDLGGRIGADVYATGNGRVIPDGGGSGYGRQVLIDHGFGYKTRYAHLNKVGVVPGQMVKRGEKIGELGNTGRSTGPHLHYEVIYRGQHVDPVNYFRRDMDEAEFQRIIELAKATTFEAD